MADVTASRIVIPVQTGAKQANIDMSALNDTLLKLNATLGGLNQKQKTNRKETQKTSSAVSTLKKVFAAIGVGLVIRKFVQLTDTYTGIQDKLKLVTNGTKELTEREKQLFDVAQKSRSSFQSTAELYARLSRSTKQLNVSSNDLLTVTDSINKAFLVSGASSEEASNAIRQLSQGLAAGALRGDEFNSVAEQAPRLQEAIAASLGVTVGQLRGLAAQGKITSKVIVDALKGQADVIDKEFQQLTPTFGQVGQQLANTALKLGGAIGQQVLPDIAVLGQAFIALSKDGGVLIDALTTLFKGVVFLAKGFVILVAAVDKYTQEKNFEKSAGDRIKATQKLVKSLQAARNELGLTAKTRPKIVAELTKIIKAQDGVAKSAQDIKKIEAAKEYLKSIKQQSAEIDKLRDSTSTYNDRVSELSTVLEQLTKKNEDSNKQQITSQAALITTQKKRIALTKEQIDAFNILAEAGDPKAFIKAQRIAFEEQKAIVKKAGLDVTNLEKFQQMQRQNQFANFFKNITDNQNLSFIQRQEKLKQTLKTIQDAENLSNEERLAAQQAYNQQSALLEQQRFQAIANSVQFGAQVLGDFNQIAQSLSQVRQNQIAGEIQSLEERGASEEEIAKKRAELQRKAAIDQKRFATIAAILDTAVAVTKALASTPPPASYALAALSAAKGAAQIAAIRSQPIPKAQFGGTFEVPPGNQADSGLLKINQGEEVTVTPVSEKDKNSGGGKQILMIDGQEFEGYLTSTMQRILNSGKITINRTGVVRTA